MSDFQQGPGWWIASDGKWYPPQVSQPVEPKSKLPIVVGALVAFLALCLVLAGVVAVIINAGEGIGIDRSGSPSASTTPTTSVGSVAAAIKGVYPGVPADKSEEWSLDMCRYMKDGLDGGPLISRTIGKFAGGDRPDPTVSQAVMIIGVIRANVTC